MSKDYNAVGVSIITRLQKEAACYEIIFKLSCQQKQAIISNDTNLLMSILNKKQKYMQEIDHIHLQLNQLRSNWEQIKDNVSGALRSKINELVAHIGAILKETVALEKENVAMVNLRKDEVAQKLSQFKTGKEALKGYLNIGRPLHSGLMDKIS